MNVPGIQIKPLLCIGLDAVNFAAAQLMSGSMR